jgi:hypothetical protein
MAQLSIHWPKTALDKRNIYLNTGLKGIRLQLCNETKGEKLEKEQFLKLNPE